MGVTAVSTTPLHSPRNGVTVLAFSSYPNGFPVLDLDEKTAKKMVEKALPSVSVEQKRLLFGRTKWEGRTVGAVVYPISEQDIRQVQNILNDSRLSDYERNMKINDYMPTVMSKDTGGTRIFDIQRDKLLGIQEAEDLAKVGHVALADANKQAAKITSVEGATFTPYGVKEKGRELTKRIIFKKMPEANLPEVGSFETAHQRLLKITKPRLPEQKPTTTSMRDSLPLDIAFVQGLSLQPLKSEVSQFNNTLFPTSQQGSTLTPSSYKEQPVPHQPTLPPFPWQALIPPFITEPLTPLTVPPQHVTTDTMFPQRPLPSVLVPIGFYATPVV